MKINNQDSSVSSLQKSLQKPASSENASAPAKNTSASDTKATLSEKSQYMAQANQVIHNTPEVREQKVQDLKQKITQGQYQADFHKVADKLVDEHLLSAKKE